MLQHPGAEFCTPLSLSRTLCVSPTQRVLPFGIHLACILFIGLGFSEDHGCKVVLGFCQSKLCKFPKVEAFLPTEDQKKGSLLVFPCCIKTSCGTAGCQRAASPPSPARPMPTLVGLISLIQTTRKQPGSEPCS